jgi:hypothetical protein
LDAHGRAALLSAKTVDERNALVWESFGFKREDVSAITESLK